MSQDDVDKFVQKELQKVKDRSGNQGLTLKQFGELILLRWEKHK